VALDIGSENGAAKLITLPEKAFITTREIQKASLLK